MGWVEWVGSTPQACSDRLPFIPNSWILPPTHSP